ncbi:hypothetical protein A33Q_2270 [Indibacter alkaliphilus LW1]|uniref:Uncharacterized protein n=1 Tax=Indibacter alkaliphilus (strain CCUG 57479 / KCTC 22604 / LW1) TaxID=1189612 RepID=S2DH99_INDAL|nr:hypothetical protein A33Q_2270 [Indibacter alkaliphilus LW1]
MCGAAFSFQVLKKMEKGRRKRKEGKRTKAEQFPSSGRDATK